VVEASFNLSGLTVLVTAASSGIGLGVAKWLSRWGARVVLTSRSPERLSAAAKAVEEFSGRKPLTVVMDLMDGSSIERGFDEAWRLTGGIDLLVFNAGHAGCEPCMLHEASYRDWLEASMMHVAAPGYITSLYLSRLLEEGRRGTIVYLSSASVREPMRFLGLADTARAGLIQLAKLVARVYGGYGVRAYVILLGSFDTPGARKLIERIAARSGAAPHELWEKEVLGRTPLGRTGRFEELAGLIAFLATGYADYATGAVIELSGAMTRCA
jgi:NAD(P)-dependent dehydrogenase (short-subunit alcohol dehydrogenase family)